MDVRLLSHTPDPERAIAAAARLCYAPVGAAELLETMSDEAVRKVLKTIITSGHTSALEHASYTFAIDGVSRALTHQLVRHRLASYNQQSQRYVSYTDEPAFIVPPEVAADPEALKRSWTSCAASFIAYRRLLDSGVPRRGRALPAAQRHGDQDRRHHEHPRAAALLRAALLQARAVGDPRAGTRHAANSPSPPLPTSSWTPALRAAAVRAARAR